MAHKQARRRKATKPAPVVKLPRFPWRGILSGMLAVSVLAFSYQLSLKVFDQSIEHLSIRGPFVRVSAMQIEAAISEDLDAGFFSAKLSEIRRRLIKLEWVDDATVTRRWPDRLEISVTEQVPAAVWGNSGLLNTRGELFVDETRHIPAELPRLKGPAGQSQQVASNYLQWREDLLPLGMKIRSVELDARGAWQLALDNGIEVRLGRRDVQERAQLFVKVATQIVARRDADIHFIDMRYSNGFSIRWKDGVTPVHEELSKEGGMFAELGQ